MDTDSQTFEFELGNKYFADIDSLEVQKGKVHVTLVVKKTSHAFELSFRTDGVVTVPCDRCLDDMELPISSADKLMVKFGPEYAEEGDDLIIIPEDEGTINVAWFIYEFIALAIPIKHVHAPGKCNKEMSRQLNRHLRTTPDEEMDDSDYACNDDEEVMDDTAGEADKPIDPRWNELKKILDNN